MKFLINKIKKNHNFFFTFLAIGAVLIWYLNFQTIQSLFLFWLVTLIYLFLNFCWCSHFFQKWGEGKIFSSAFGLFALLYLIAFLTALPITFYKITPLFFGGILIFLTLALSFLNKIKIQKKESEKELKLIPDPSAFRVPKIVYFVFFFLLIVCFLLLFRARTGNYIRSPWEVIHPFYLYGWLIIVLIIGFLILSKIKLKRFLLIIILASLLLHAYLLIPYQAGFGGDKWRHLGAERWLMEGRIYEPALGGTEVSYLSIGPWRVPEVLVAGNKTSYAQMWGLTISLSWLTGIDVFYIDLILGALLFSFFLPFLLARLALFFSRKKEFIYLVMFLPFLFYPFQIYGSITVPVSFSFLPFIFLLIWGGQFLKGEISSRKFWTLMPLFLIFLYFSYILYFFAFLVMIFLAQGLRFFYFSDPPRKKRGLLIIFLILILGFALMPLLDTHHDYSIFKISNLNRERISEAFQRFGSALFFSQEAIFPRIYQFEQDSWLYSQTRQVLSRSVLLEIIPWWLFLSPLVCLMVLRGIFVSWRSSRKSLALWLILSLFIFLVNQMIASSFMEGNHLFTKRLVLLISFLFFFPLAMGLFSWLSSRRTVIVGVLIFSLALISVSAYASGPKFQVVTQDEREAAHYIWSAYQRENTNQKNISYCVLANTWPLLALEGVSGRQIITGGFPYYFEYRQPERVQLFDHMNQAPSLRYLEKALEVTGAKSCYFMTEARWVFFDRRQEIIDSLDQILGPRQQMGEVMIWHYRPENNF
ncbi:hypothetical protein K9K85_01940 [Patescibacteria group bacterium]|nr:hypothetical protein [Patescibacteria group bacterium]